MYDIHLPKAEWFLQGNDYTGSLSPDPTKGCLSQTTFNYQVKLVNIGSERKLMAICYYMLPWNDFSNMDEGYIGRFHFSDFGVEVCEKWIRSKFVSNYPLRLVGDSPAVLCDNIAG